MWSVWMRQEASSQTYNQKGELRLASLRDEVCVGGQEGGGGWLVVISAFGDWLSHGLEALK